MEKTILSYRVIIQKENYPNKDTVYTAYCPTLDIADYGNTIEDALNSIKDAIKLRLEVLAEEGEQIPRETKESLIAEVSIVASQPVLAAL